MRNYKVQALVPVKCCGVSPPNCFDVFLGIVPPTFVLGILPTVSQSNGAIRPS